MTDVTATTKPVREGSAVKRQAILEAARDLFVRRGIDRVSMDTVAASAKVSKVTVYDYFGDKQRLYRAILAAAAESLDALMRRAIDAHLADDAGISTQRQLGEALVRFAVDLGTSVIGSSDHAAAFALVSQQRWQSPGVAEDVSTQNVQDILAERIAHFAKRGLLAAPDARTASAHFVALTILLAYDDQPDPSNPDTTRVRRILTDGAHAFIRAYTSRRARRA